MVQGMAWGWIKPSQAPAQKPGQTHNQMSKPHIFWIEATNQSCTIAYCAFGGVKIALDHEVKQSKTKKDKFRIRCLLPRKSKLSQPVVFTSEKQAREVAELEARRIHNNKPTRDENKIEEWRAKATEYDKVAEICAGIKHKPVEAAYELVHLYKKAGNRTPEYAIDRWFDEYEFVKTHLTVADIVEKQIRIYKHDRIAEQTKRTNIAILRVFAEEIGNENLIEHITVSNVEDWLWDLDLSPKTTYDYWLIVRTMFRTAYNRYRAITQWTFEQLEELNYSAQSNQLDSLMPNPLLQKLFAQCKYANDALYLGALSFVALRRAELLRLDWKYIRYGADGRPRFIELPARFAKGELGFKEGRFIDIPFNLAELLIAFKQTTGPIIVGTDHQLRLAAVLSEIEPTFKWEHNILRRTCISNGVAHTRDKFYYQHQAGHDEKSQKAYLRPVDPLFAEEYMKFVPDIKQLKTLPYAALECPKKVGRPKADTAKPIKTKAVEAIPPESILTISKIPPLPVPEPCRSTDGTLDWKACSKDFLEQLVINHTANQIAQAWGTTPVNVQRRLSRRGITITIPKIQPEGQIAAHKSENPVNNHPIQSQTLKPDPIKMQAIEHGPLIVSLPNASTKTQEAIGDATESLPGAITNPRSEFKTEGSISETDVLLNNKAHQVRKTNFVWPSNIIYFEMLWSMPASQIAKRFGCSTSMVIVRAQKYLELPTPGHGYWQKVKRGIKAVIPQEVVKLYLKLRAELPPGEVLGAIPEVFRSAPAPSDAVPPECEHSTVSNSVSTEAAQKNLSDNMSPSTNQLKCIRSRKIGRPRNEIPLSKPDLLEQLWLKPMTQIARELGCSKPTIKYYARELKLPPPYFWQQMKFGDKITIPEKIQSLIMTLRNEIHDQSISKSPTAQDGNSVMPCTPETHISSTVQTLPFIAPNRDIRNIDINPEQK